jgi:hypothetical protein
MVGKKGATKSKGKDSRPATTAGDGWRTSKCFEADLKTHVDECLLQPKEIIMWQLVSGDKRSYEGVEEVVLFQHFLEHGLALPTSDFFCCLFFHYGLQLAAEPPELF